MEFFWCFKSDFKLRSQLYFQILLNFGMNFKLKIHLTLNHSEIIFSTEMLLLKVFINFELSLYFRNIKVDPSYRRMYCWMKYHY